MTKVFRETIHKQRVAWKKADAKSGKAMKKGSVLKLPSKALCKALAAVAAMENKAIH